MNGNLHDHLVALRDGASIPVGEYIPIPTRYGDDGEYTEQLGYSGGEWSRGVLNCTSGSCSHNSHDKVSWGSISRQAALAMLREHIATEETDAATRATEIAWLDHAISQLG